MEQYGSIAAAGEAEGDAVLRWLLCVGRQELDGCHELGHWGRSGLSYIFMV
jgi:hypothetical protein